MKRTTIFSCMILCLLLCLMLAGCDGAHQFHLITPEPPLPTIAPAVVPPTATEAPTLPTVTPTPEPTQACVIKGNINTRGEKIYYLPGQVDYKRVVIDLSHGEKFFCSEADAQAAGFRKAKK